MGAMQTVFTKIYDMIWVLGGHGRLPMRNEYSSEEHTGGGYVCWLVETILAHAIDILTMIVVSYLKVLSRCAV